EADKRLRADLLDGTWLDRWYPRACGPAVEKTLAALVKEGTNRARSAELERLQVLGGMKTESSNAGKSTRPNGGPSANGTNGGMDRRAAVDAYIEEVYKRTGKHITRTDIWKSARYKSRTEFERWERNDPDHPNKTAHQR